MCVRPTFMFTIMGNLQVVFHETETNREKFRSVIESLDGIMRKRERLLIGNDPTKKPFFGKIAQ